MGKKYKGKNLSYYYVFSSDFANSLKIPAGVVYPVIILSSIYTIILSYFIGKKQYFYIYFYQ